MSLHSSRAGPHIAPMKNLFIAGMLALLPVQVLAEAKGVLRPQLRPERNLERAIDTPPVVAPAPVALEPRPAFPGDAEKPQLATAAPIAISALRPPARPGHIPRTRWQHKRGHALWTRAALAALKNHGRPLVDMVPADVEFWCPAYPMQSHGNRRAFWVGFMSALAKHESTYKAAAVGGGGRWYGLLQILPATARGYKCNVGTGDALKNGAANLSCAVRILAVTVPRDGVIYGRGGRGVAADWGPMRNARKRVDMANWLKRQSYCMPLNATRPRARP